MSVSQQSQSLTYTLARPTFSSGPDDAVAAIDVYKEMSSGVINSYQETPEQVTGTFDKLTAADATKLVDEVTDSLKSGADAAMAVARGVVTGDYFKAGSDALTAFGVGKGEVGSALQTALKASSKALGLVRNLGAVKSISQVLAAGGAYAGRDGAALTKLAYSVGSLDNNLSSFKNLRKPTSFSGFSQTLSLGAGMSNSVGAILGDMSPSMAATYNAAAKTALDIAPNLVKDGKVLAGRAMNAANAATASKAIGEFTGGTYGASVDDSAGLAGSVAGLAYVGHQSGLPGTFGALTDSIDDDRVCRAAGVPLMQAAAIDGDVTLFMDVANSKVGGQMCSAIPELSSGIVSTAVPPADLAQQEYGRYYDDFSSSLTTVDPEWQSYSREGGYLVKAAYVAQNPFMGDMVCSRMNSTMSPDGSDSQSIFELPTDGLDSPTRKSRPSFIDQMKSSFATDDAKPEEPPAEAFMMLGTVFPTESVDSGFEEHFPFFHAARSEPIVGIPC